MQTRLDAQARQLPDADEAERILRSCVHCGFCNATCPTYQILGDERDGPRGRIYLMKQMLEGGEVTRATQTHLDRCLSCRNCETTCPSGVTYHRLLDIGRAEIDRRLPRKPSEKILRHGLRFLMTRPRLFACMSHAGRAFRPLLPKTLADKLPARPPPAGLRPATRHARRMLMLEGCVQPSLSPNTNAATARVLDRLGISIVPAASAGCCGAVDYHLDAQDDGLNHARRNIDAWWPQIEAGAEAIIQTASGCGAFVKEYGHLLRQDPAYAAKARRVSALTRDLVEVLRDAPLEQLRLTHTPSLAFHCPCTLQHAQKLAGAAEDVLTRLGFTLKPVADGHLCCGSAGTYSITQPELSTQLRDNKLAALQAGQPDAIATANIGCQIHLGSAAHVPVRHWIELVDAALAGKTPLPTATGSFS